MAISGAPRQRRPNPWAALVAVLALLTQGFVPAAAVARPDAGAPMVICTAMGAKAVASPGKAPDPGGQGGHRCALCAAAAHGAPLAGPPATAAPAVYALADAAWRPAAASGPGVARAPPRPPSQAPPSIRTA